MTAISNLQSVAIRRVSSSLGKETFSSNNIKNLSVTDQNSTEEQDSAVVKILSDKKTSLKELKRNNEIYDIESTINSKSFEMFDALSSTSKRITQLLDVYEKTDKIEQKDAIFKEISDLSKEFNKITESDAFKTLEQFSANLASKDFSKGEILYSSGMQKSLNDKAGYLGGNFIAQAKAENINYFKTLISNLSQLKNHNLSATKTDGTVSIHSDQNLDLPEGSSASSVMKAIQSKVDKAFDSFLEGTGLNSALAESIKGFEDLENAVPANETDSLDLASSIRDRLLANGDPENQFHPSLTPFAVLRKAFN